MVLRTALQAFSPEPTIPAGLGGDTAIHGVKPDETEIWMDLEDRLGHTLLPRQGAIVEVPMVLASIDVDRR